MSYNCSYCNKSFSRKDHLVRHIKNKRCKWLKIDFNEVVDVTRGLGERPYIVFKQNQSNKVILDNKIQQLEKQIAELIDEKQKTNQEIAEFKQKTDQEINQLKSKPLINNQILQVISVGTMDNYLDMLTNQLNDFDKALEYIKDCALSHLRGDCKLIKKIYFDGKINQEQMNIRFLNKNRTKIEYYNEKKVKMHDSKEIFGRKIANNLQNTYLKGVNHLITTNLENRRCPNKFLEEYDLQIWNQHIYDLSDLRYQKKIINQLDIPIKSSEGLF